MDEKNKISDTDLERMLFENTTITQGEAKRMALELLEFRKEAREMKTILQRARKEGLV